MRKTGKREMPGRQPDYSEPLSEKKVKELLRQVAREMEDRGLRISWHWGGPRLYDGRRHHYTWWWGTTGLINCRPYSVGARVYRLSVNTGVGLELTFHQSEAATMPAILAEAVVNGGFDTAQFPACGRRNYVWTTRAWETYEAHRARREHQKHGVPSGSARTKNLKGE